MSPGEPFTLRLTFDPLRNMVRTTINDEVIEHQVFDRFTQMNVGRVDGSAKLNFVGFIKKGLNAVMCNEQHVINYSFRLQSCFASGIFLNIQVS